MDQVHNNAPEWETAPDSESLVPAFEVDVATVSVVDGMWQDQPDNVATFAEARLGDLARGRGNLYVCLDVSGEVEGRSEIERALIEVIRDTFASGRGSISFALSEALRAANAHLYELNRQVGREMRRMAGVSAVILRGNDLYIAQAGPAVVYVEASEKLSRYPNESDWFVEDAPLIPPQGTASAPLGIRREFASDLAHASVAPGDVFVLATRALTQLASTEELAIAFTERSAQDIASHVEELGQDSDMTALIAELMHPRAAGVLDDSPDVEVHEHLAQNPHIESLPVPLNSLVTLDESEPPLETPDNVPDQELVWEEPFTPAPISARAEPELNWDDEETEQGESPEEDADSEPEIPQPVYAAAAAAMPMPIPPAFAQPRPITREEWEAELEQRRQERAARRTVQKENMSSAVGGVARTLMVLVGAVGGVFSSAFGAINWDGIGKQTNRGLNLSVSALISFFLLLVRLVLPGASPRATSLIPRRTTSDPVWLKALAVVLPVLFISLAVGRYMVEVGNQSARVDALIAQADTIVKQAEVNPDKVAAHQQLDQALKTIREAQAVRDSPKAKDVLYRIQDQLMELDGVAVLRWLPVLAQLPTAQFKQVVASDQDVFLLDGRGRVYQFLVNDASGDSKPVVGDGAILKIGDKVGSSTIGKIQLLVSTTRAQDKAAVVAVTDNALLSYDLEAAQWSASPVTDSGQWGDLRAISSFNGNIYLLDAKNGQIYRYTVNAAGYTPKATNYFSADAQPLLNKAVDMAIDGDIWVLNDNGVVQRFRSGVSIPFELGALSTPLNNPVAIFTRPEVDSLYIADAGNHRIVEFDKNGKFVRQFAPDAQNEVVFKNLQDFFVNETKRKFYFATSNASYLANVPK